MYMQDAVRRYDSIVSAAIVAVFVGNVYYTNISYGFYKYIILCLVAEGARV